MAFFIKNTSKRLTLKNKKPVKKRVLEKFGKEYAKELAKFLEDHYGRLDRIKIHDELKKYSNTIKKLCKDYETIYEEKASHDAKQNANKTMGEVLGKLNSEELALNK